MKSAFLSWPLLGLALSACASAPSKPVNPVPPGPVAMDAQELSLGFAPGDSAERLSRDLSLPGSGPRGSRIEWTSSRPDLLGPDGRVNRPAHRNQSLLLTARLTASDPQAEAQSSRLPEVRQRTFPLTVLRAAGSGGAGAGAYTQTITLDGELGQGEWRAEAHRFTTSHPEHFIWISYDAERIYLALEGPAVWRHAPEAGVRWFNLYLAFGAEEPGASRQGTSYREQHFDLPFPAVLAFKWRPSDGFLESAFPFTDARRERTQWNYGITAPGLINNPLGLTRSSFQQGERFMELALPRAALGDPVKLELAGFWVEESPLVQRSFGFWPASAAQDRNGPGTTVLAASLLIDLSSRQAPAQQPGTLRRTAGAP